MNDLKGKNVKEKIKDQHQRNGVKDESKDITENEPKDKTKNEPKDTTNSASEGNNSEVPFPGSGVSNIAPPSRFSDFIQYNQQFAPHMLMDAIFSPITYDFTKPFHLHLPMFDDGTEEEEDEKDRYVYVHIFFFFFLYVVNIYFRVFLFFFFIIIIITIIFFLLLLLFCPQLGKLLQFITIPV
jgi:hypothetical protein